MRMISTLLSVATIAASTGCAWHTYVQDAGPQPLVGPGRWPVGLYQTQLGLPDYFQRRLLWEVPWTHDHYDSRDVVESCDTFLEKVGAPALAWKQVDDLGPFEALETRYSKKTFLQLEWWGLKPPYHYLGKISPSRMIVCLDPIVVLEIPTASFSNVVYDVDSILDPHGRLVDAGDSVVQISGGYDYGTKLHYDPGVRWFSPDMNVPPTIPEVSRHDDFEIAVPWGRIVVRHVGDSWGVTGARGHVFHPPLVDWPIGTWRMDLEAMRADPECAEAFENETLNAVIRQRSSETLRFTDDGQVELGEGHGPYTVKWRIDDDLLVVMPWSTMIDGADHEGIMNDFTVFLSFPDRDHMIMDPFVRTNESVARARWTRVDGGLQTGTSLP